MFNGPVNTLLIISETSLSFQSVTCTGADNWCWQSQSSRDETIAPTSKSTKLLTLDLSPSHVKHLGQSSSCTRFCWSPCPRQIAGFPRQQRPNAAHTVCLSEVPQHRDRGVEGVQWSATCSRWGTDVCSLSAWPNNSLQRRVFPGDAYILLNHQWRAASRRLYCLFLWESMFWNCTAKHT